MKKRWIYPVGPPALAGFFITLVLASTRVDSPRVVRVLLWIGQAQCPVRTERRLTSELSFVGAIPCGCPLIRVGASPVPTVMQK